MNVTINVTETQGWTLVNGLRVASDKYLANARAMEEAGFGDLAEQFKRQAAEALRLQKQITEEL